VKPPASPSVLRERAAGLISVDQAVAAVTEVIEERAVEWGEVAPLTPLDALGLDSLELAELSMVLEEICGAPIDPRSVEGMRVVADLTEIRTL
jgi:acyl carrier protein